MAGKDTAKKSGAPEIVRRRKKRTNEEKLAAMASMSNAQLLEIIKSESLKAAAAKYAPVARGAIL